MTDSEAGPLRVFLVEDHDVMRRALGKVIRRIPDLVLCGEAPSAEAALEQVRSSAAQLVVVDISLPGMDGIELIRLLHERDPQLLILAVSGHDESVYGPSALRAGARGYVMKGKLARVMEAIRQVRQSNIYATDEVLARLDDEG